LCRAYTRGAEVSRPFGEVVDEARALVDAGAIELTLLGQNVNAWQGEDDKGRAIELDGLIRVLDTIPGLRRIRYTTSHPRDMDDELIASHRDLGALMPYLHLPVQAGSDRILDAMNRHHTAADYLRLVERIRAARPDIALSGDFIVGFPGETAAEFEATMRLVEDVGYAQAYSFKYSARPGTPAADAADQVAEAEKSDRLARLQELLTRQQRAFNTACAGRVVDVLMEREGRKSGQIAGRSPYLQAVQIEAPADLIGTIVPVEIVSAGPNSLNGRLAGAGTGGHA